MKKTAVFIFGLFLFIPLFAQQSFIPQSLVINVEVPVRVFSGNTFVSDLKIDDFTVYENGVEQKIEAVYFIKKNTIQRSFENTKFFPETSRTFFLFFEVSDYDARIKDALDYFCSQIIVPGDKLYVVTPMKTYKLVSQALERKSPLSISRELNTIMRQDIQSGNSEYRDMIRNLTQISQQIKTDLRSQEEVGSGALALAQDAEGMFKVKRLQELLLHYSSELARLETIRKIDQLKLLDFARFLKAEEGQKTVFLFYQREYIPMLDGNLVNDFMSQNMDYSERLGSMNIFRETGDFFKRDISLDVDKVKRAFADSSISVHFLMINNPRRIIEGITMKESSEDIFNAFRQMAMASGGFMDSSARPDVLMESAANAAENYYLLYYSPKDYTADGRFKVISVNVKDKKLKVVHRKGYFAY